MSVIDINIKDDNVDKTDINNNVSEVKVEEPPAANKEVSSKEVKIEGPLSKVFTEALNIAYSKENVTENAGIIYSTDVGEGSYAGNEMPDKGVYVYAIDGSNIDSDELINASNKIINAFNSRKFDQLIVSSECVKGISPRIKILQELCTSVGAECYVTRNSSIVKVINSLRK